MRFYPHALTLAVLFLTLPWGASAVDGVLEINQACAASGCFPGDAPGFPVTIDRGQTGSYRLTSNLVNLDPDVSAIQIQDYHVTLDLNGFAVSGPTVCTGIGASLSCLPTGGGAGIQSLLPTGFAAGIVVKNGVVRGFPFAGIIVGDRARVEAVYAVGNGGYGINVGYDSMVAECRVERNWRGIQAGGRSVIRRNVVVGNEGPGIAGAPNGGVFVGNVIRENGGVGIAHYAGLAVGNAVTDNGGGMSLDSVTGYARNVLRGNGGGLGQVSGGFEIGPNLCGTDTTCP